MGAESETSSHFAAAPVRSLGGPFFLKDTVSSRPVPVKPTASPSTSPSPPASAPARKDPVAPCCFLTEPVLEGSHFE